MRNLASLTPVPVDLTHGAFDRMAAAILARHAALSGRQLFTTNVDPDQLWSMYLSSLPLDQRQHHTCNCCKRFFRDVGGLVSIEADGSTVSAVWPTTTAHGAPLYAASMTALKALVEKATVTGPFFSAERTFGRAEEGGYTHFALPNLNVFKPSVMTAFEQMALKREHFGTVARGLDDYPAAVIDKALALLSSETLWRGEKVAGAAKFLADLHASLKGVRAKGKRQNIIWRAIATAPAGFCTPRSGVIGTLLDDLKAGKTLEQVKNAFAAKMNPLQYQRPQVAAAAGNIARGESIVKRLGLDRSLERRWAMLSEVRPSWVAKPVKTVRKAAPAASGVFASLDPRGAIARAVAPAPRQQGGSITFARLQRVVLPTAKRLRLYVEGAMYFGAMTTEVYANSPPLFQWEGPIAWYTYPNGSTPSQWGLRAGSYVDVMAMAERPGFGLPHFGPGYLLALDGAKDSRNPSRAIFPETLRSELHEVRRTIEQYSRSGTLRPASGQLAAGLLVTASNFKPFKLIVVTDTGEAEYTVDRWD